MSLHSGFIVIDWWSSWHTMLTFHVTSTCVTGLVSFSFLVCWLTLNRSLFRFYCICHCLLTKNWFVQCQQHLYIGIILQYNSGSLSADFEQVIVSIRFFFFFTWILCIYTILEKNCLILCVFGLNSTVRNHIVGVHLTRSLNTLWWMLTFIIVFYCICVSNVSSNLQCVLVFDTIF